MLIGRREISIFVLAIITEDTIISVVPFTIIDLTTIVIMDTYIPMIIILNIEEEDITARLILTKLLETKEIELIKAAIFDKRPLQEADKM
jgi:hypothetical protein